ncbi:hypothetical protein AX16_008396 [Volvariella volvacea WC 439]|nr:hypothetical protein AX16_008396 [Volvariella volvacea WC 439]
MYTASPQFNHTQHPFFSRFFPTSPSPPAPSQADSFTSVAASSPFPGLPYPCSTISEEDPRTSPGSSKSASMDATHSSNPVPIPQSLPPSSCRSNTVSLSPAAMFLSSFSPVTPQRLPDDEGQVVAGYTLGETIGYGGFSTIRKAFSKSGGTVAVKIVRQSDLDKQADPSLASRRLRREASTWASLSHEHILPLFSAHHTSYADFFFTLYCPAGSLFDILKRDGRPALPQDDVGMMFRQVVRGLRYLHEVALSVHRDIKLENVLVDEMGVCRIGDFGMTRKIGEIDEDDEVEWSEAERRSGMHRAATLASPPAASLRYGSGHPEQSHMFARNQPAFSRHRHSTSSAKPSQPSQVIQPGSLPYASPELLLPQTSGPLLPHPAQDVWAVGVMLYALLTGRLPFNDSFEPRLQMKIINGAYEVPSNIGRNAERVLKGCLERSVPNRWNIVKVDEVAWGVGWGIEGEDATPEDSEEEAESQSQAGASANGMAVEEAFKAKEREIFDETTATSLSAAGLSSSRHRPSAPPSRSQSRQPSLPPSQPEICQSPVWQNKEGWTRPSLEAAERRSTSRAQRSKSRAPVLGERSSSVRGATSNANTSGASRSRHHSRSRAPSPCFAALNAAVLGPDQRRDHTPDEDNDESALLTSPVSSVFLERGRKPKKLYSVSSRSPSPSVVPTTPVDWSVRFSGIAEHHNEDDEHGHEEVSVPHEHRIMDASRGRRRFNLATRDLHPTVLGPDTFFTTSPTTHLGASNQVNHEVLSELDGIEGPPTWSPPMGNNKQLKPSQLHMNLKHRTSSLLGSGSRHSLSPLGGHDDFASLTGEAANLEAMSHNEREHGGGAGGASSLSMLLTERWLEDARLALRRVSGLGVDASGPSAGAQQQQHRDRKQRPESTPPTPVSMSPWPSIRSARSRSRRSRADGGRERSSRRGSPAPGLLPKYNSAPGPAIPGEREDAYMRGRAAAVVNGGVGLRRSRSLGFEPKKEDGYRLRCV